MSKPYVYIIEFKELGKRYIGVRYAKGCDKAELLQPGGYFTSSKSVRDLLKKGQIASIVEIIEFDSPKEAVAEEARLIKEGFACPNNNLLNMYSPSEALFHMRWYEKDDEYMKEFSEKVKAGYDPEKNETGCYKKRRNSEKLERGQVARLCG